MTNLTIESINSRETYLAYRTMWKAEYKTLSKEIRELKLRTKALMRLNAATGYEQNHLSALADRATYMLTELADVKALGRAHRAQIAAAA